MNKKAQALLELALFVGIMLMVLLAALSYQRNLREQRLTDENVFTQAKLRAFNNKFTEKDIDGQTIESSGAVVSYSLNADRQANRLFQGGQRRAAASSASVYYSNSEDPPNLEFNYYSKGVAATDIDIGELPKKIYWDRPGGTEDPEDGLKLNAADWVAVLYPALSSVVTGLFNLKSEGWWALGGYIDFAARAASFAYLTSRYAAVVNSMDKSEAERAALEANDKQMSEWGWRISDKIHDGDALAGKKYVKEVFAQAYDVDTAETKSIDYGETQTGGSSSRAVTVGHNVARTIRRRFDVTSPDPTIPLASHTFEILGEKAVAVDLGGVQSETWN